MICQLLKRDDVWRFAPYYVLGSAVVYPFLATSVLAFSNLTALYLVVSGMTLACLLFFNYSFRTAGVASATLN